jgi:hypothetical protein
MVAIVSPLSLSVVPIFCFVLCHASCCDAGSPVLALAEKARTTPIIEHPVATSEEIPAAISNAGTAGAVNTGVSTTSSFGE